MQNTIEKIRNVSQSSPNSIKSSLREITRGARIFGVRDWRVSVESSVLEDYAELDEEAGQNLIGAILSLLAYHLTTYPARPRVPAVLAVCATRRADDAPVELELEICRGRKSGKRNLILRKREERFLVGFTCEPPMK